MKHSIAFSRGFRDALRLSSRQAQHRVWGIMALLFSLTACAPDSEPTGASPAVASTDNPASASAATKPTLLARWQSFSYNPPRYAVETLEIYNDFSCAIASKGQTGATPCHWARADNDQLTISFPKRSDTLSASLRPAKSIKGKQQPGVAGYLVVTLAENKRQIFVLDGSEDAQMVRDAIDGESLWIAGQRQQAVEKLNSALQRGSTYARLRLGWLYASNSDFLQPALALKLLLPLRNNQSYPVQNALAVAYAADGNFPKAIQHATLACALGNSEQQQDCQRRLAKYRSK